MKILVLGETSSGESRVAATPDAVKKLVAAGHDIHIETQAGLAAGFPDAQYKDAGATITEKSSGLGADPDLLLSVRCPELSDLPDGLTLVGLLDPFNVDADTLASKSFTAFAMEAVPRITRAQSMDALSSQSNLSGYRAVIEAANLYGRAFPMMMTAAGTVAPAKCFVMGAGVAGLQAIATARRLGAVVSATDVRPAVKEQVASLGAKFIAVEDDEFKAAETSGGYAKQMSAEYQAKQAELTASHIAKQDIVITTALIPGRPAPELVTEAMVASMPPGAVIIDLAAAQGGNCKLSRPDEVVTVDGVKIYGPTNLPAAIAADASALYARNLLNFLALLTGEDSKLEPDWDDEIVSASALARQGEIVHASLKK